MICWERNKIHTEENAAFLVILEMTLGFIDMKI